MVPQTNLLSAVCAFFIALSTLFVGCYAQGPPKDSLNHNFTLAALNITEPNANLTGAPLVLGAGGATSGIYFYITSTYASFPYNDYPSLGLVDKGLRAFTADGGWRTNATDIQSLGRLGWVTTTIYQSPAPQVYQAVKAPAYRYPLLAAHSFANLWSLCPGTGNGGQVSVVFNVTADASNQPYLGYDPAGCYSVLLQMVPLTSTDPEQTACD